MNKVWRYGIPPSFILTKMLYNMETIKMFSFCKDVYYVIGKENACFYDLNRKRLLHCSKDYINIAKKAIENKDYTPNSDELNIFNRLLNEQIIQKKRFNT